MDEECIDKAVENFFMVRMKLGVFDQKGDNPFDAISFSVVDSTEMQALNEEVARRSVVLLKNENQTLPLNLSEIKTIGVIGPNANNRRALIGNCNYEGTASRYITMLEGIRDYMGEHVRVLYSEGGHLYNDRTTRLAQANNRAAEVRQVCTDSDVVIAVMGLDASIEGEQGDVGKEYGSGDKPNLNLSGVQQELLEIAKQSKKPVILCCQVVYTQLRGRISIWMQSCKDGIRAQEAVGQLHKYCSEMCRRRGNFQLRFIGQQTSFCLLRTTQ